MGEHKESADRTDFRFRAQCTPNRFHAEPALFDLLKNGGENPRVITVRIGGFVSDQHTDAPASGSRPHIIAEFPCGGKDLAAGIAADPGIRIHHAGNG